MKFISKILLIIFMLILFSIPAFSAETLKLGVAGVHGGDLVSYGIPSVNAARLVVKKVNAKGGILEKSVSTILEMQ